MINTLHIYGEEMRMEFGISKCGILIMQKRKIGIPRALNIPSSEIIKEIDLDNGYKY